MQTRFFSFYGDSLGESVLVCLELAHQLCLTLGLQPLKVVHRGSLRLWTRINDFARYVPFLSLSYENFDTFPNKCFCGLVGKCVSRLLKYNLSVSLGMTLELR